MKHRHAIQATREKDWKKIFETRQLEALVTTIHTVEREIMLQQKE